MKKIAIPLAGALIGATFTLSSIYELINPIYYRDNVSQEYRAKFEQELEDYAPRIKRRFPAEGNPKLTVGITLYVDAEFKRNQDSRINPFDDDSWEDLLESSLEKSAKSLTEEFEVGLDINEVKPWNPEVKPKTKTKNLLYTLEKEDPPTEGAIAIIGRHIPDTYIGMATKEKHKGKYYTVVRDEKYLTELRVINASPLTTLITHELSHWLGATDIFPPKKGCSTAQNRETSIMDYCQNPPKLVWDQANKTTMRETVKRLIEEKHPRKDLKTKQR